MCCPDVKGDVFWILQKSFATLVAIFQTAEVVTVAITAAVKEYFTSADDRKSSDFCIQKFLIFLITSVLSQVYDYGVFQRFRQA
jgi:hypothetical protein